MTTPLVTTRVSHATIRDADRDRYGFCVETRCRKCGSLVYHEIVRSMRSLVRAERAAKAETTAHVRTWHR